jgi:hypothetical protein
VSGSKDHNELVPSADKNEDVKDKSKISTSAKLKEDGLC